MADTTKLAALRVTAEMDAAGFTAGANEIDAAAKKAGAATKVLSDAIKQTGVAANQMDTSLRPASDGLNRLLRSVVDGYAASQNLERALNTISRAFDKGKLSADMASRAIEGAIRKHGSLGDAAIFASKNQLELAAATDRANASLGKQAGMRPGAANQNMMGGQQFAAQNVMYQLQDIGVTAAMGMSPLMIAMQQGTQISAALGPMGAAGAVGALKGAFIGLINPVSLVTIGLVAAGAAAIQYLMPLLSQGEEANKKLEEHRRAIEEIAKKWGEVAPAFKAYADERERLAEIEKIEGATKVASDDQWTKLREQIVDVNIAMSDYFQQAGVANSESTELREAQSAWSRLRSEVEGGKATAVTARDAQKELLDLFKESGIPGVKEFADTFGKLADEIDRASSAASKLDAEGALLKLNELFKAGISNSTLPNIDPLGAFDADKAQTERANNTPSQADIAAGIGMPIPASRPASQYPMIDSEPDKAATAYDNLTRAADQRIEQLRNEISLVGQATEVQARLRAEFEAEQQYREQMASNNSAIDQRELDALREKARLQSQLTQQLAGASFDKGQQQEIAALQQRASVIGMTAEAAARSNAVFAAEQQMRQQGLSLLGEEADKRRAVAAATADYASQIQRSEQAYTSLQTAGGSAIDALFASTGSLEDRMKNALSAMLQWVTELSLINPMKNQLLGTNLPTLADLGKPAVPGLSSTSTATMTVTAGVVNLTGGQFPAIPGTSLPGTTTGTLSSALGITNGVRPTLTPSGVVNSPVPVSALSNPALSGMLNDPSLASRTTSPIVDSASRVDMWRQSISKIESGSFAGNYNALGPVTRSGDQAYGRYQVMGNNVPSWSEKWYGEKLTPDQFRANPAAQDAVFDGQFGSYVSKYGEGPAATKWFTGSHVATGKTDGYTVDSDYQSQFEANMKKLSTSSATASKDIGTLGDSSQSVSASLADIGKIATPAATPAIPAVAPTTPTASGGGIFSSLFGGIFKLFGFADGTDFAPGGVAMVGERGKELVNLPRGSQVIPNHKLQGPNSEERMRGRVVRHDYSIQISGMGDRDLLAKMQKAADESVAMGLRQYHDQVLPGRVQEIAENPEFVG